jgi:hypothetical protein
MPSDKKLTVSLTKGNEEFLRKEAERLGLTLEETLVIFLHRGVTRLVTEDRAEAESGI